MEWQPWLPLYLNEIQKALDGEAPWREFVATGCTQSGKTVGTLMIPMLFFLFELGWDVGFAIPTMELAASKWAKDIKPIILKTRYANLIPTTGAGSKGGDKFDSIHFLNGSTLKFITAGGGREERSSETFQAVIVTEADSFSEPDEAGGEGRKIDQLKARTHAFGGKGLFLAECTVTTENNFTWDTLTKRSSNSKLVLQCPGCSHHYLPEREHLIGWQEATTQLEAGRNAKFLCPECGLLWADEHRPAMLRGMKLLHGSQAIGNDGSMLGELPETRIFGFRWNAALNSFWTVQFIGEEEWSSAQSATTEATDLAREQFAWVKPAKAPEQSLVNLDAKLIQKRVVPKWTKGLIPADVRCAVLGIDIGRRNCHWVMPVERRLGLRPDQSEQTVGTESQPTSGLHIADYGVAEVDVKVWTEQALIGRLNELHDRIEEGWPVDGSVDRYVPDLVMIDSGYLPHLVYELCRQWGPRYRALKGFGFGQGTKTGEDTSYMVPQKKGGITKFLGNGFHINVLEDRGVELFHVDADFYKSRLHDAISRGEQDSDAFTLYDGTAKDHETFRHHLVCEQRRLKTEFIDGQWKIRWVWRRPGKGANHYLDATCYGLVGIEFVSMWDEAAPAAKVLATPDADKPFQTPDGRNYLITER